MFFFQQLVVTFASYGLRYAGLIRVELVLGGLPIGWCLEAVMWLCGTLFVEVACLYGFVLGGNSLTMQEAFAPGS